MIILWSNWFIILLSIFAIWKKRWWKNFSNFKRLKIGDHKKGHLRTSTTLWYFLKKSTFEYLPLCWILLIDKFDDNLDVSFSKVGSVTKISSVEPYFFAVSAKDYYSCAFDCFNQLNGCNIFSFMVSHLTLHLLLVISSYFLGWSMLWRKLTEWIPNSITNRLNRNELTYWKR